MQGCVEMKKNILLIGLVFIFTLFNVHASDDFYSKVKKDAIAGDAQAQFKMGRMYMIVSGDYEKAFYWLSKAAKQGNAEAQADIGSLYYYGKGVKKDIKKAEEWFVKASQNDDPRAQNDLAMLYLESNSRDLRCNQMLELLNASAKKGYDLAYYNIGNFFSRGICVERSMSKAVDWWEKASHKGNAEAEFNLYVSYSNGSGVSMNQHTGYMYLRKSCEHGYKHACDLMNK